MTDDPKQSPAAVLPPAVPPASEWGAPVLVWGVWAVGLVLLLGFVREYGSPFPFMEDWAFVPVLTGDQPADLHWLWEQGLEHRYPLPKALVFGLLKLSGGDFRAPGVFCVLALGGLTFALVRVARAVRGWTSYADAFLPLIFFQGAVANRTLLWSNGIFYLLPSLLALAILLLMVRQGTRLTPGLAALAGVCLALLPLCSGGGQVYFPPLACWLAGVGVCRWRAAEPAARRTGLTIIAVAALAALPFGLYFLGYERKAIFPTAPDARVVLGNALTFLAAGFGTGAAHTGRLLRLILVAFLLVNAGALVGVSLSAPKGSPARARGVGLLLFLAAVGCLSLALGWGRADAGHYHVYYQFLAVPVAAWIYLVWAVVQPRSLGHLLQTGLLMLACLTVLPNVRTGQAFGQRHRADVDAFRRDLLDGQPVYQLLARHYQALLGHWGDPGGIAELMPRLRQAGIGDFRHLREGPPLREITLPVVPAARHDVTWESGTAEGSGANSSLTFALSKPRYVAGVRVRCAYLKGGPAAYALSWPPAGQGAFPADAQFSSWGLLGEAQFTVYVADTIDRFRFYPGNQPFAVRITEIVLLVPEDGT